MSDFYYSLMYAVIPITACIIDTVYGDPRSNFHPVVLIGNLISYIEDKLYPKKPALPKDLMLRGLLTVCLVLLTVGLITSFFVFLGHKGGILLYFSLSALILYVTITPRALARDGMEIYHLLRDGDLVKVRARLSWIVGRDTDNLSEADIVRGTVETIAENTTDGIISPLFYFMLFGPVGAALYRAGNTMDSMLGYKDDRYLYFGRIAARLDDILNYIPARITFLLFAASAYILRLDWKNAVAITRRDARKHPSPNGGYAEAPMAGALNVRLGGYNYYHGVAEFREYMGDPKVELKAFHIKESIIMMYLATAIFVIFESIVIFFTW